TEAVTNIVGRADLIAGFAVLSSVLLYARSRETTGARRWMSLVALTVVTTIGVFAKESAVVIVGVAMLFAICFRSAETSRSKKAFSIADGARGLRRASVALAVPLLLLWIQRTRILGAAPPAEFPFVDNPIVGANGWTGFVTALVVMVRY